MSIAHGIRTLGVLGAGQMGTGIALVAALRAKVPVVLHDRSPEQITSGLVLIDKLLAKDVAKGRITSEQSKEARDRVRVVSEISGLRDVDMVVEVCVSLADFRTVSYMAEWLGCVRVFATQTINILVVRSRA
jgi:3-hydroxybutyryl-CoA dehydrogenase